MVISQITIDNTIESTKKVLQKDIDKDFSYGRNKIKIRYCGATDNMSFVTFTISNNRLLSKISIKFKNTYAYSEMRIYDIGKIIELDEYDFEKNGIIPKRVNINIIRKRWSARIQDSHPQ